MKQKVKVEIDVTVDFNEVHPSMNEAREYMYCNSLMHYVIVMIVESNWSCG